MFNPLIHVTMKENYFVSYETAENLLKLGYNEPCEYYYPLTINSDKELMNYGIGVTNDELQDGVLHYPAMSAPTLLEAVDWLNQKGIYIHCKFAPWYDKIYMCYTMSENVKFAFISEKAKQDLFVSVHANSTSEAISMLLDATCDYLVKKTKVEPK